MAGDFRKQQIRQIFINEEKYCNGKEMTRK